MNPLLHAAGWLAVSLALLAGAATAQPLTEAAKRADIAQFRSGFLARDRAYSAAARQQAEQRLAALQARVADVDDARFALALAQIVALADNGHSASYGGPRLARFNRVELRLVPFGTDFHVLRAQKAHADLLGARLLAVDGVPLASLREAAHTLTGGPPAWRDRQAPYLLESPQLLHALELARAPEAAVYRFEAPDGRVIERRLAGAPPSPERPHSDADRLLLPEVLPERANGADTGWRSLLAAGDAPWSLREPTQPFRWRHVPELGALVVEMRQTVNGRQMTLNAFYEEVRAAIADLRPEHLVLDLRLNGGGDLTQARDFAESLPKVVPGQLFVLMSPWTFSAAISLTGYLKQAAPARVRIVGEEAGDRLAFFAEGCFLTLANSGEVLLPATERHDYRDGCRRYRDCHRPVVDRPIAVPSLAPDIAAPWTLADYRRGVDPAMAAVAAALGAR